MLEEKLGEFKAKGFPLRKCGLPRKTKEGKKWWDELTEEERKEAELKENNYSTYKSHLNRKWEKINPLPKHNMVKEDFKLEQLIWCGLPKRTGKGKEWWNNLSKEDRIKAEKIEKECKKKKSRLYRENNYKNNEFKLKSKIANIKWKESKKGKEWITKYNQNPETKKKKREYFKQKLTEVEFKKKHLESCKKSQKKKYHHDSEFRDLQILRSQIRNVYDGTGSVTKNVEKYLGCDLKNFRNYLNLNCKDTHNLDLDHIIPVSYFKKKFKSKATNQGISEKGLKLCFHYTNYQLLDSKINRHVKKDSFSAIKYREWRGENIGWVNKYQIDKKWWPGLCISLF